MTKKSIFRPYNPNKVDPVYKSICGAPSGPSLDAHKFVEDLWTIYEPYADRHQFLKEIQLNFHNRFWEMYLTCTLLKIGLDVIKKRRAEGPDVCVKTEDKTIWFEAVCPTRGTEGYSDSIPDIMACNGQTPVDKIVLRIRSVIKDKYVEKYSQHKNKGIIQESDAYVVAVNTWQVFPSGLDIDPHPIFRACFGVGSQKIVFDSAFEPIDLTYEEKTTIPKPSGEPVRTDIFSDEKFKYLSAVLWSASNAGNPPDVLGKDFRLAYNPLAVNRIPEDLLKRGAL